MFLRKDLERLEDKIIAPYGVKSKNSRGRKFDEEKHPYRTCFQRDRDRIIHSHAFRRLEYKTQVFIIHEGDYFRTRLTHTLEVSQIARIISQALRLNQDLTEAISLAHDLGHTPFGHSGEEILNELMQSWGGFNHNNQGLRIVDFLEEMNLKFQRLNLTWEVREGIAKHSPIGNGFQEYLEEFEPQLRPTLEAQVVIFADEIAYDSHDLDDDIKSGLIEEVYLKKIELWKKVESKIKQQYTNLPYRVKIHLVIRNLIDELVSDLIFYSRRRIEKLGITSVQQAKEYPEYIISFSPHIQQLRCVLRDFLYKNLYRHYKVVRMSCKAKMILKKLFESFVNNPQQLPPDFRKRIEINKENKEQVICDYIAGMTDRFAKEEYEKLFEPGKRV